jgi:uncharacterized membrane protein YccC
MAWPSQRLLAFARAELGPNPGRVRAFLRLEVALVLATLIAITFKPANAYWTVVYLLLVTNPSVGNSVRNAIDRLETSIVGSALAILLIIAAYDAPWVYLPLQALFMGVALYVARSTPLGAAALTGGATFAIISGSDVGQPPSNLITLAFYRVLQATIGGGLGAFAQLALWPDDPLVALQRSLAAQLAAAEAGLRGEPVALDAGRVARNFELLANAQVHHPGLGRRRTEIAALIVEVGCVVDDTLHQRRSGAAGPPALREALDDARRRLHAPELFTPPLAPPPPPPPLWRAEVLQETMRPAHRSALKMALSAFLATITTQLLGYPAGGALFTALAVSMQVSSGTALSKSLIIVGGLALAFAVVLLIVTPAMPNLDDPGSYLVVAAIAFAPTAWLAVTGARVRNAGLLGTVIVTVSLFADFRAGVDLEAPARLALGIAIGALVVAGVDRVVWPVDARLGMWQRAAAMMRAAAALYRERDARVVLAPDLRARWRLHRHLVALVQLRSERAPLPGSPCFEPEEEALRAAGWTLRLVVARIEEAGRELEGVRAPGADAEHDAVAARLDERAAELEAGRRKFGRAGELP